MLVGMDGTCSRPVPAVPAGPVTLDAGAGAPDGRLAWVDVAKGASIVLVVLLHVTNKHLVRLDDASLLVRDGWAEVGQWLRPVRMPLFFLLSGLWAAPALDRRPADDGPAGLESPPLDSRSPVNGAHGPVVASDEDLRPVEGHLAAHRRRRRVRPDDGTRVGFEGIECAVAGAPIGTEETIEDIERCLYAPNALVHELTPPLEFEPTGATRRRPTYRWTRSHPR
jgi:hypothetical protein